MILREQKEILSFCCSKFCFALVIHCSISVLKREILLHCSLYHVAASFCSCSVVSSNDVGIIVATGYQIDLVNLFCCFRLNIQDIFKSRYSLLAIRLLYSLIFSSTFSTNVTVVSFAVSSLK